MRHIVHSLWVLCLGLFVAFCSVETHIGWAMEKKIISDSKEKEITTEKKRKLSSSGEKDPSVTVIFDKPISLRDKFAQESSCKKTVIDAIDHITKEQGNKKVCSMKIAMYSLDEPNIIKEANKAIDKGVHVEMLLDASQNEETIKRIEQKISQYKNTYKDEDLFKERAEIIKKAKVTGIVGESYSKEKKNYQAIKTLHEKFAVFSCKDKEENKLYYQKVIVGSYNWTSGASTTNHENCLVINELESTHKFENHFNELKNDYKIK